MGRKKDPKPKFEKYEVVSREEDPKLYGLLDDLTARYHRTALEPARISLAWAHDVKPDKDGRHQLWQVKIPSKVDRQLHGQDLIVILNNNVWRSLQTRHEAILDEALCSIVRDVDKNGDVKEDAKGRPVYHVRKPDVKCFSENVRRFGPWPVEVHELIRENATKLPPPERTLLHVMTGTEPTPPPPPSDPAGVKAAFNAIADGMNEYRGFRRAGSAKSGKGMVPEAVREAIDRIHSLIDAGKRTAANALLVSLREAGWRRVEEPAAAEVA